MAIYLESDLSGERVDVSQGFRMTVRIDCLGANGGPRSEFEFMLVERDLHCLSYYAAPCDYDFRAAINTSEGYNAVKAGIARLLADRCQR